MRPQPVFYTEIRCPNEDSTSTPWNEVQRVNHSELQRSLRTISEECLGKGGTFARTFGLVQTNSLRHFVITLFVPNSYQVFLNEPRGGLPPYEGLEHIIFTIGNFALDLITLPYRLFNTLIGRFEQHTLQQELRSIGIDDENLLGENRLQIRIGFISPDETSSSVLYLALQRMYDFDLQPGIERKDCVRRHCHEGDLNAIATMLGISNATRDSFRDNLREEAI